MSDIDQIKENLVHTFYFDNRTRGTGPQTHEEIRAELDEKSEEELRQLWAENKPRARLDALGKRAR